MGWAEIKKAINSDLTKPLNTLITEVKTALESTLNGKASQTSVTAVQTTANTINTNVNTVNTNVSTMKTSVDSIRTSADGLKNVRWVTLGSYAAGTLSRTQIPLNVHILALSNTNKSIDFSTSWGGGNVRLRINGVDVIVDGTSVTGALITFMAVCNSNTNKPYLVGRSFTSETYLDMCLTNAYTLYALVCDK